MGSLSNDNGLTPHFGEVTYSSQPPLHVLEASGWSVSLWLANVPLSGKEDPLSCGYHDKPYPDPAQFLFYAEPRFFWVAQGSADAVQTRIVESLKSLGYDVRPDPVVCGSLALLHSH